VSGKTITKSWPYCEGHPSCHDSRTRQYAYGATTTTNGLWGPPPIIVSWGSRDQTWGKRLCRAHALIEFRVA